MSLPLGTAIAFLTYRFSPRDHAPFNVWGKLRDRLDIVTINFCRANHRLQIDPRQIAHAGENDISGRRLKCL